MRFPNVLFAAAGLLALACSTAHAHPQHPEHGGGLVAGLLHPLLGLDHLLAMVAVGLWSAQLGGRSLWALPGAFVGGMLLGGIGSLSWTMIGVEYVIALSVLLLGGALAFNRRLPLAIPLVAVSVFGFYHGHAHGAEMPALAAAWQYAAGFVAATIVLHTAGVLAGRFALGSKPGEVGIRISGAAIAVAGVFFLMR